MKFRTRLLILLLVTALAPLALSFLIQRASLLHVGTKLANDTRTLLNDNAVNLLHALVDDYDRILERDKATAAFVLQGQAQAVTDRFAALPPSAPKKIYFSADYDSPAKRPDDVTASHKLKRITANGGLRPIPVSFSQQVVFLVAGVQKSTLETDLARISDMGDVYRELRNIRPDFFLWQYTALASGIHSSFPGKGGYPADYDPRQRHWYQRAVNEGRMIQELVTDLSTGGLILTLAQPLFSADGALLGVTALDIDYLELFSDWDITPELADQAQSMVMVFHDHPPGPGQEFEVLLRNEQKTRSTAWKNPVEQSFLDISTPELKAIRDDLVNGRSGVRKIMYQGREELWAYGARTLDEPFPLVIVPYENILAQVVSAENYVKQQIALGIKTAAGLTFFVVIAVVILALVRSRTVTRPVLELSAAAVQMAQGDFDAKVTIRSKDELGGLGEIFNGLGPRLKERDAMIHSLALAKEIQQQLLPRSAPECSGFDLAGRSLYCDETGGDYYDFIPLGGSDERHLALAVGDVSGHGIGPALVMAAARGILRTLADRFAKDPTRLLHDLNQHLCRDITETHFMTMFYGILKPNRAELSWLSAGHAPIFHLERGEVKLYESSGIPLGIMDDCAYEDPQTIRFSSGDLLLIATDGVWETENSTGDMFGTDKVSTLLQQNADLSAASLSDKIIATLVDFRGAAPQTDDITLLVIKTR
ncbi:MAG: hypothetical protein C0622_14395 [Desulfuromonas sp.]|nr:MAG: hypothetical protein C0622_14395 [Desulfuromonas sp.]